VNKIRVSERNNKTTHERKVMNNQFDELTKTMAQSVTRRGALKKFGVGLAGMALACLGLANKAEAAGGTCLPSNSLCSPTPSGSKMCCSGRCLDRGRFRFTCA
jgi:hypothetical protein